MPRTFAEIHQDTGPCIDLPPLCTSAVVVYEFVDGSVHAGTVGSEDDADRLISAAADLYGVQEFGVANLHNVHYPVATVTVD